MNVFRVRIFILQNYIIIVVITLLFLHIFISNFIIAASAINEISELSIIERSA